MANLDDHPLDRVLIVAPHPDDEVIATGGLIQRALAGGGTVRILLLTGGERNPWPQRAMLRRWTITDADREDWTRMRLLEAADGLAQIGASYDSVHLLGYPDTGLMKIARSGDDRVVTDIEHHLGEFNPSLVVSPSFFDAHGDHRAASLFVHRAVDGSLPIVTYAVHGFPAPIRVAFSLRLSENELAAKAAGISAHTSQLLLSRERMLEHVRPVETFYGAEYDVVRVESRLATALAGIRHAYLAVRR